MSKPSELPERPILKRRKPRQPAKPKRPRGRPPKSDADRLGNAIMVRLTDDEVAELDRYVRRLVGAGGMTRPEAIRRLMRRALGL